jgi:hypothetical protein
VIDTDLCPDAAALHQVKRLERKLAEARAERDEASAEVAAFLDFLRNEQSWEYFREGVLYCREPEKATRSQQNAAVIGRFLAETGRGKAFLSERDELLRSRAAWATAATDAEPLTRSVDVVGVTLSREAVEKVREALTDACREMENHPGNGPKSAARYEAAVDALDLLSEVR